MRRLDLAEFEVSSAPYGTISGDGAGELLTYNVRQSLTELLFSFKYRGPELLEADALARKIRDWTGGDLLLEEEEYARLRRIVEELDVFGPQDVELVRRVLEAPEVEVEEKA